jgi:hypothetical protein
MRADFSLQEVLRSGSYDHIWNSAVCRRLLKYTQIYATQQQPRQDRAFESNDNRPEIALKLE